MLSQLVLLVILSIIVICILLTGIIRSKPKKYKTRYDKSPPKPTSSSKTASGHRPSGSAEYYLIGLLNGDRHGAERLIRSNQLRYPDRDKLWCVEKTIEDVVRDRR
jgi:hypothetical protein